MAGRPLPPDDIAPDEFFTRWIPEIVAADAERRARLGAADHVLLFELEGDGGGLFHLRVREGLVEGYCGAPERVDLRAPESMSAPLTTPCTSSGRCESGKSQCNCVPISATGCESGAGRS
jgi:hypothetical protein